MFDHHGGRKYLNEQERTAFFDVIVGEPDALTRAFCLTLFYTGCRISEAINLTFRQVDMSQNTLVFETLKRRQKGVYRSVPVPDGLIHILIDLKPADEDISAHIWNFSRTTAYRHVKRAMKRAGVCGSMASPKGLRHSFATACVARNVPITTVQAWLGHSRLETTAIYLSVSGEEERGFASRLWTNFR